MVVVTVRPRRKSNTTSNAFGVERSDSLTLVTSWIASATHQTGQWPPTGHAAVDLLAGTGTGTCSQRLGRGGVRRDRLPQDLWLADWFAVDCPREIDSRRAFRRHVGLDRPTGRGFALWRSQPVGSLPLFFRPFQGGQSCAQLG